MTLVLGPVLRHVGETTATVWVQTDAPAEVAVLGCTARTFQVQDYHYALVPVQGLAPDSTTEYQVHVDGHRVWPQPDSGFPPSVIRTRGPASAEHLRVVFGSCRYPKTGIDELDCRLGHDALDSYAARMSTLPTHKYPDALLLLGDQVYADELTPDARRHLAGRRRLPRHPPDEVVTYSEYEDLYRHTWTDPEIRWILSTVPTAMIVDDHDIRDDWNTSAAWRAAMSATPWWRERIRAGLASYWVYQHLGNLSPDELFADKDFESVLAADGDTWPLLVDFADRADGGGDERVRFSFRWDFGHSRLVMVDSRNARVLGGDERKMLGDSQFAWLRSQVEDRPDTLDHLLIGSSLPWLLPPVVGDLETVNEIAAARPGLRGRLGEKIRQAADLEHWPAFMTSFLRLSALIADTATRSPSAPATVTVLSGDVHHSYAARADFGRATCSRIHQLVCSPVHNDVPAYVKPVFTLGWSRRLARVSRRWARRAGAPALPVSWTNTVGPLFGNTIATFAAAGRSAEVVFEQPGATGDLRTAARASLTG